MFVRCAVLSSFVRAAAASAPTVQEAWNHHADAFGTQDLEQIMVDYMESSVIEHYDYTSDSLVTASGLNEIQTFFKNLFNQLSDMSCMTAPVLNVTDSPVPQTYLIWAVPCSNIFTGVDTFLFAENNKFLRQQIVTTKGSGSPSYGEVIHYRQHPTQNPVPMDESYAKANVQDAFDNHWTAIERLDLQSLMQDYTETTELQSFDHSTGVLTVAKGLAEIQRCFEALFSMLTDLSGLASPVVHVTDQAEGKQVFLVWSCPSSGIIEGVDSFIYDNDYKIVRQNIAYRSQRSGPEFV